VFTDDQAQAIRTAWRVDPTRNPARPMGRPEPETGPGHGSGQPETRVDPPGAGDDQAVAWQQLVAEVRAERDRAIAERDAALVTLQQALRRAEEAERGRWAAEAKHEALRAALWRWLALCRRPLWRLRPMPDPPPELGQSDRLLTG
jgi:hypothetical protein